MQTSDKDENRNDPNNFIIVKGARAHNLKNIDVRIPKNKLVVITGVSGSGKSSLAFDTIYAEGQRRYVESLSAYARQFLGVMDKPDVDYIEGLSPAISIDQKSASHNPRSTVGTVTEIYDYLRLLFARVGHPHSPTTGARLKSQTISEIVDTILAYPTKYATPENEQKIKVNILAPVVKNRKGTYEELFARFLAQGYVRVRVDGNIYSLEEEIKLDKFVKHSIELIVDRLVIEPSKTTDTEFVKRLSDSVELAVNLGSGELLVNLPDLSIKKQKDDFYSEQLVDPISGESFPKVEPHSFSFNSPFGACEACNGLGVIKEIDSELIYNPRLSVREGGIYPWANLAENPDSWAMQLLIAMANGEGIDLRVPMGKLTPEQLKLIFFGSKKTYSFNYKRVTDGLTSKYDRKYDGVIPHLMKRYKESESDYVKNDIEQYMSEKICPTCLGKRLKGTSLAVTILGKNIYEVGQFPITDFLAWLESSRETKFGDHEDALKVQEQEIGKIIFKEISTRTNFLLAVGLDYLTLNRTARTLSGGESQRIRLASQIGTGLTGVLYVLDEPSIGLHQSDNERLLTSLQKLKSLGNSVVIVEHDEDTIRQSDYIIDIGPGAGEHGGNLVAEGKYEDFIKNDSLTAQYLSGRRSINRKEIDKDVKILVPDHEIVAKKFDNNRVLKLNGVTTNNLKNVDLTLPLGKFVAITGVSGSGKSSLINETLYPILSKHFFNSKVDIGPYKDITGLQEIDKVINIDQSPIGRTPRSNPATYTGLFGPIRELYAATLEAKNRGYTAGRFSFNTKGGRCENCGGDGVIKIEMQFLSDVYVTCEICNGQRYNRETLQVDFKGKNIAEVLNMTVEEASNFFENFTAVHNKLSTLVDVGLGYIRLGQAATTLSGGEAQRVKLATELSRRSTGKTLYILDEPTTGLHFEDVRKLLIVLHGLVAKGNSVVVIEHNLDLIRTADWIVDLGPRGGVNGGEILAEGTVQDVANSPKSLTGKWLKQSNQ